jgi:quercetin dioxygenase-like cupin family protein
MIGAMRLALGAAVAGTLSACGGGDGQSDVSNQEVLEEVLEASPTPLIRTSSDPMLEWGPCPQGFPQGCGLAVLHGDPAKPGADVLLRVPGGTSIPPHTHSSAERMILTDGVMEVRYQGSPPVLLREGSYGYGPADLPHEAQCRSNDPCVLFIAFNEPVDAKPFSGAIVQNQGDGTAEPR